MLRPSTTCLAAVLALLLCNGSPALAQLTGLSDKLDVAEQQLDSDIHSCKPIDVRAYEALVDEANRNYKTAMGLGIQAPTDLTKLHSDKNRSVALRDRAKAAAAKACQLAAHGGGGTTPIDVETKVEPPKLGPVAPAGHYKPQVSTETVDRGPDYVGMFGAALQRFRDAKNRCDGPAMMAARGEMDAAQGAAREVLAKEKELGGRSEVLKQMADERQNAENGTVSICPSLTPALAHMLSEPPRVSTEPLTDDSVKAYSQGTVNSPLPTVADQAPAVGRRALPCTGPALGDFGKSAAAPPPGVVPEADHPDIPVLGTYGEAADHSVRDSSLDEGPTIRVGLKYSFDGQQACPVYENTREPQPEIRSGEVFKGPFPIPPAEPPAPPPPP